jgi:hypothetical protein
LGKEKKGFNSGATTSDLEGVSILIPPLEKKKTKKVDSAALSDMF